MTIGWAYGEAWSDWFAILIASIFTRSYNLQFTKFFSQSNKEPFTYDVWKNLKSWYPSFPLSAMIQFWSDSFPSSWKCFLIFLEKFNILKINILTHKFFTLLIRKLFVILMNIIKLPGKRTELNQPNFYERLMYLHCLL